MLRLSTPITKDVIKSVPIGEPVLLSGRIFTARDAAHKKLTDIIKATGINPLADEVIYYAGPCPSKPNEPIGSVGPTTSYRMDTYIPLFLQSGCLVTIGKGKRTEGITELINASGGVHFEAIGGAGAYYKSCIKSACVFLFPELGAEAVYRLEVVDFPCVRLY